MLRDKRTTAGTRRPEGYRVLFGYHLDSYSDPSDHAQTWPNGPRRFRSEIHALKAYFRAGLRLCSAGGGSDICSKLALRENSVSRRDLENCVKISSPKSHGSSEKQERDLQDFLDIRKRISAMEDEKINLLIAFYIFKVDSEDLCRQLSLAPPALGGKISQARRALRRALKDLLPNRSKRAEDPEKKTDKRRDRNELCKRAKALRFLRARAHGAHDERESLNLVEVAV